MLFSSPNVEPDEAPEELLPLEEINISPDWKIDTSGLNLKFGQMIVYRISSGDEGHIIIHIKDWILRVLICRADDAEAEDRIIADWIIPIEEKFVWPVWINRNAILY